MPDRSQFSSVSLSGIARFRHRAYVFTVTALAVFLWGFAISRALPEYFTATATIQPSPAMKVGSTKEPLAPAVIAATIRRELTSEEHLATTLRAAEVTDRIGTGINELNSDERGQIADLRRHVQVEPLRGRDDDDLQIAVSYTNRNAARAALVVNQVVSDYAARLGGNGQTPASPAYDRAHQAVEAARQKATSARAALSEFIAQQRDKTPLTTHGEKAPESAAPATKEANSAMADLNKQLQDLTTRRAERLTRLTEQHPEVQQLEWQISELQKQLDAAALVADVPSPQISIQTPSIPAQNWLSAEEADQYARLATAVDGAQDQLDAALKQERAAWDEQVHAAGAVGPTVLFAALPSQPDSAARQLMLAGSVVLALAAGLAMAVFAAGIRPLFVSVAQAQAALPVPIVGAITTNERHAASARRGSVPLPFRFATFLCELSLAMWLIAAVSLSLADRHFGSRMLHDPAGALSDAISRLIS